MEAWLESGHTPYKVHSWFHGAANMDETQYWPLRQKCYMLFQAWSGCSAANRVDFLLELLRSGPLKYDLYNHEIIAKFKMFGGPYGRVYYEILKIKKEGQNDGS